MLTGARKYFAKNDKLCPQESLPLCSSLAAPGCRLVDGLGPHAEHRHPEVGVVREESPGEDGERAPLGERGQAPGEVRPVGVVPEDGAALQAPDLHVVQRVRRVQAGVSRHGRWDPSITC